MSELETEFGDVRKGPGNQMPEELIHAKLIAQHAQGILSDIIKGAHEGSAEQMVTLAFNTAKEFDKQFQAHMNEAVQALPKIHKPPAGLVLK